MHQTPAWARDWGAAPLAGLFGTHARLQTQLEVGPVDDPLEREADATAERVMRMADPATGPAHPAGGMGRMIQRACACGGAGDTPCPTCAAEQLQRQAEGAAGGGEAPAAVHAALHAPGQPLDAAVRSYMEPRFGLDFAGVRVHADAGAAESARAIHALAYTVGQDIVFAPQQYQPGSARGRALLAHELTHVVQQRGAPLWSPAEPLTLDRPDGPAEHEAQRVGAAALGNGRALAPVFPAQAPRAASRQVVARANTSAVSATMRLGTTAGSGIQFWPTNVTDTQVGPVSVQPGLLNPGASRLHVIIGANVSMLTLANQLLPLWEAATRFTPPGAAAPLPLEFVTEEELAQALMVYNQNYLPVPSMANWRAGFRFPLPVEIDPNTGIATLHPLQVRALATGFDPAWAPLLDRRTGATTAPAQATLQADVTAFLARVPDAQGRGIHLGARAETNAVAELPFIREVFRQLGNAGFDVALQFMDNLVNTEIELLAAQRDGAAILGVIRAALATAPAALTADQQASLTRANLMLGRVAGAAAVAPPAAATVNTRQVAGVSTPLPRGVNAGARFVINGVGVIVQPDVRTNDPALQNKAETTINFTGFNINFNTNAAGNVTSFTGPGAVTVTVRTRYGQGVTATSISGYGRGTTATDIRTGQTALGFHEGRHGLDYMEFLRLNTFPQFGGRVGMTAADFQQAIADYRQARTDYSQRIDAFSALRTDCVGTTIDQNNAANGIVTTICTDAATTLQPP